MLQVQVNEERGLIDGKTPLKVIKFSNMQLKENKMSNWKSANIFGADDFCKCNENDIHNENVCILITLCRVHPSIFYTCTW